MTFQETDSDADGMDNGYEYDHGVKFGGWQNLFIYNARYAVLIGGRGKKVEVFGRLTGTMYEPKGSQVQVRARAQGLGSNRLEIGQSVLAGLIVESY